VLADNRLPSRRPIRSAGCGVPSAVLRISPPRVAPGSSASSVAKTY
jgi:hypothetical protein